MTTIFGHQFRSIIFNSHPDRRPDPPSTPICSVNIRGSNQKRQNGNWTTNPKVGSRLLCVWHLYYALWLIIQPPSSSGERTDGRAGVESNWEVGTFRSESLESCENRITAQIKTYSKSYKFETVYNIIITAAGRSKSHRKDDDDDQGVVLGPIILLPILLNLIYVLQLNNQHYLCGRWNA